MERTREDIKKIREAMEHFVDAFTDLACAWDIIDSQGANYTEADEKIDREVSEIMSDGFPFSNAFEETYYDTMFWAEKAVERLERVEQKMQIKENE